MDASKKLGRLFKFRFLIQSVVVVSDPELYIDFCIVARWLIMYFFDSLRQVWVVTNTPKSEFYKPLAEMIGSNLLTENGEVWKSHRKMLQTGYLLMSPVLCFCVYCSDLCYSALPV